MMQSECNQYITLLDLKIYMEDHGVTLGVIDNEGSHDDITMLCMLLLEVVCHKRFPHPLLSRPHHGTHTEIVDVLLASVVYTPS